jgi:predicted TIM-barrel fold metal-dependent hydrolase
MMWGSDYPHDEGTFPHSREVIERTLAGISREDKERIVGGNAARLYGFPLA